MRSLEDKEVVVVGLGRTGYAAARFCARRGARVTVSERAPADTVGAAAAELAALGVRLELGGHRQETFRRAELIVISPGIPPQIPPVAAAAAEGVPVIGEIELAAGFIAEPIVAVSGTNGKTTTCELLAEMLRRSGKEVFLGGNIGNPLVGYLDGERAAEVLVVEVSSFQLDTADSFRPQVAVLLNITPDHLDRYPGFEDYAASKMRLFRNQQPGDTAVLNAADPEIARRSGTLAARRLYYPLPPPGQGGAWLEGERVRIQAELGTAADPRMLAAEFDLGRLAAAGGHNRENACAAALAALAAGATPSGVQAAIESFRGLPHRMEEVGRLGGVTYVNDSKATNVDAVARALACYAKPVILIMGGLDKDSPFEVLAEAVARRCRRLIVTGAAAGRIREALGGQVPTERAGSLREAVAIAGRLARPGETVLLSPGCASFDCYRDYRHRGEDFRAAVAELAARQGAAAAEGGR